MASLVDRALRKWFRTKAGRNRIWWSMLHPLLNRTRAARRLVLDEKALARRRRYGSDEVFLHPVGPPGNVQPLPEDQVWALVWARAQAEGRHRIDVFMELVHIQPDPSIDPPHPFIQLVKQEAPDA